LAIINTTACISTSLLYAIACILHIVDAHGKNGKYKESFTEASKNLATKYRSENNFVWTIKIIVVQNN